MGALPFHSLWITLWITNTGAVGKQPFYDGQKQNHGNPVFYDGVFYIHGDCSLYDALK